LLSFQGLHRDVCNDFSEHRMAWLRLNSPLAELDAARIPLGPIWPVWIRLNSNDEANRAGLELRGDPFGCWLQGLSIDVCVDSTASEEDEVSEEVGLEDWQRQ